MTFFKKLKGEKIITLITLLGMFYFVLSFFLIKTNYFNRSNGSIMYLGNSQYLYFDFSLKKLFLFIACLIVGNNGLNQVDDKYLNLLLSEKDEQIKHLKEELKEKNKSLDQAMELVKNNQVLLLQSQDRVLMLETSSSDEKKSFWSKFKKNQTD